MKLASLHLGLGLVPLAFAASDSLSFAVAPDTAVARTASSRIDLDLVGGWMRMGDEEEQVPDGFEIAMQHATVLSLEDTYLEVDDGMPTRLARTYADVERTIVIDVMEDGREEDHVEDSFTTDLEGEGVAWTWDEDEERHRAAWLDEDTSLSDDLLEGLVFDFDALALLPQGDVEQGASWTVEAADIAPLLGLGGDLAFAPSGSEIADEMVPAVYCTTPAHASEGLTGELEATLAEFDSDRGRVAVIQLRGEVLCNGDVAETANDYFDALGGGGDLFAEVELDVRLDLEGQLVWDLDAGRVASLELTGPLDLTIRAAMEEGGMEGEVQIEFEGSGAWSMEVE